MARRPKDDDSERRTAFVGVHLTPSAHAEVTRRAASYGLPVSAFAGKVLLSDLKAPAPTPRDAMAIRALAAQIARAGNSVNQMAHVANATHALPHLAELREVLAEIKAALVQVRAL
jgi:hypothetical protein